MAKPDVTSGRQEHGSFLVDLADNTFRILRNVSPPEVIRKHLAVRVGTCASAEWLVIGGLLLSTLMFGLSSESGIRGWEWVGLVAAVARVADIIVYQVNVVLFDARRAIRKGASNALNSNERSIIMIVLNYIETVVWFGFIYRNLTWMPSDPALAPSIWLDFLTLSATVMIPPGSLSLVPKDDWARCLPVAHSAIGYFMTLLVLGWCVTLLPQRQAPCSTSPAQDGNSPAPGRAANANVRQPNKFSRSAMEDARVGYQTAIDLAIYEGNLVWAKFSAMLTANSVIAAVLGYSLTAELTLPTLSAVLPILGLVLCIVWYLLIRRGLDFYGYWLLSARELEETYFSGHVKTLSRGGAFAGHREVELRKDGEAIRQRISWQCRWLKVEWAVRLVILVFVLLYVLVLYFHFRDPGAL